jgi:DNA-binding LacI/PurR family transcriptional regulator
LTIPPLTTIALPVNDMGEVAARLLLTQINKRGKPETVQFQPYLQVRQSTAVPRKN